MDGCYRQLSILRKDICHMFLDIFDDKISDYGVIQQYVTQKIDFFESPPQCHTFPSFILDPLPPCCTQKSDKHRAENKSKFDVNFRPHICQNEQFCLHKTYYLDGQLHQNVNEIMITRHIINQNTIFEVIFFERVTSLIVLDPPLCHAL